MFQNHAMIKEVGVLKKDLQVHEEVEKELAKRSHFCHQVIDKYKDQVNKLKQDIKDIKDNNYKEITKEQAKDSSNEELAVFLEKKIAEIDGKLKIANLDYDSLKDEYQFMSERQEKEKKKYQQCAYLLTEYLDDILENDNSVLADS